MKLKKVVKKDIRSFFIVIDYWDIKYCFTPTHPKGEILRQKR